MLTRLLHLLISWGVIWGNAWQVYRYNGEQLMAHFVYKVPKYEVFGQPPSHLVAIWGGLRPPYIGLMIFPDPNISGIQ